MFDLMYMRDSARDALVKSGIELPGNIMKAIEDILLDIYSADIFNTAGDALKKAPRDSGDNYGLFNVIPAKNPTTHITDTLLVYCMGSDNLYERLVDTIIAVNKHGFRKVIFITTKWDASSVTGKNIKRLQDLIDCRQSGTAFCFLMASTGGISHIPVLP